MQRLIDAGLVGAQGAATLEDMILQQTAPA